MRWPNLIDNEYIIVIKASTLVCMIAAAANISSSANSWPRHLSCTSTDAFEAMCSGSDDDEGSDCSDDECRFVAAKTQLLEVEVSFS